MIVHKLALRGLARNRRSSLTLVALVAAGVFLFSLGEAFLGAAASGIREEFQESSTGDIAVRAAFGRQFGLFGFSVPSIGEYETIPTLADAPTVAKLLREQPGVAAAEPIVAGAALLAGPGGHEIKTPAFGVEGGYFALFPRLAFSAGAAPRAGESSWIVLPRSRAAEFEKAEGRKLAIGDSLQLTMATKGAFAIRAVTLKGIVESPSRGGEEGAPVYVDPTTLRSLLGLALGNAPPVAEASADSDSGAVDLDSFFSAPEAGSENSQGTGPGSGEAAGLEYAAQLLSAGPPEPERYDVEKGAWHFVLARLKPNTSATLALAAANAALRKEGMAAEAVDWLSVAGMNASVLFLLKTVFEIGIAILAAVVILVLSNGLAFSVIEQTKEIGTMRAIGAQTSFVRKLFFLQALALCLAGTLLGVLAARLALSGVGAAGIPISNDYLVMLFGTTVLKPALSAGAALASLAGAAAVAAISSVYPMYLATRTSVAQTMGAE